MRRINEDNKTIAKNVMKLYHVGVSKDWDMGDLDDVVDKYLPDGSSEDDLEGQITKMEPREAEKMWKELEAVKKAMENQLDPEDIEVGDYVDFGAYGKFYVVSIDASSSGKHFWVTKDEKSRFDPKASGNSILKSLAVEIIEPGSDVDQDDYEESFAGKLLKRLGVSESVYPDDLKRSPDRYEEVFKKEIKIGDASIIVLGVVNKDPFTSGQKFGWSVTTSTVGSKKNHGSNNGGVVAAGEESSMEDAIKAVKEYKI